MKRILALTTALSLFGAAAAFAHSYKAGAIDIGHPWARATAPSAPNGGAYLSLTNMGKDGDRLLAASTPAAEKAELHTHLNEDGVMKMREVSGIDVPAGEAVKLAPGGLHIMLLGLKQPLVKGARFPLTLRFEKAGTVDVEVAVEGAGETGAGRDGGQMQHGDMHGQGQGADQQKTQ